MKGTPIKYIRYTDIETQKKGVDVRLVVGDEVFLIDEKASIYYSNAMIPTFAFELDSIQKKEALPIQGWFINSELLTQYYMLIWPNIICLRGDSGLWIRKPLDTISESDFTIVEAMLIKKDDIFNYLKTKGIDKPYLLEYAKSFRAECSESHQKVGRKLNNSLSITYSGQIAERPINLVIQRNDLKKIAAGVYLISKDGFAKIK